VARRAAAAAALLLAAPASAETISGVCPDGSIFIVQSADAVPCREARRVEPEDVPPIKPHFLPRPYAWELFQARQDPNNPYNLVGEGGEFAARPREGPATPAVSAAPPEAPATPPVSAAAPATAAAPAPSARQPAELALTNDEVRDLVTIVELSQQRAPATIVEPRTGEPEMLLRLARSPAFEARVQDAWAAAGQTPPGPVLLFAAEARAPGGFYPNLTFAQGHVAYHPDPADGRQIGILRGRQGELAAGELSLGYVVLPAGADLAQPMDVYWNDRRITAVFAPRS
jgi:hypothetical protein